MFEDQAEQNGNTLRMADELAPQDLYLRLNVLKKSKLWGVPWLKVASSRFKWSWVKIGKNDIKQDFSRVVHI